jgi:hypothetical protein
MEFRFNYYTEQDDYTAEYPTRKILEQTVNFDDAATWDLPLNEFIGFLSSCYGYDISKHVKVSSFEERLASIKEEYGLDD